MSDTDVQERFRLPGAVYDLAVRLGVEGQQSPSGVRLTQSGRMKAEITSDRWLSFTASQSISTRACEFDWRARAGPFGLVSGRDALTEGEGRFDILALGFIPLARAAHTPALVRGELMRYLAEIAWAPQAILHNHTLGWELIDADTMAVSAGIDDTECRVFFSLDSDGRIVSAFAADRPRSAVAPTLPTPWRGQFSDYRRHDGLWLPFSGEVAWEIGFQTLTYWQCQIDRWEETAS